MCNGIMTFLSSMQKRQLLEYYKENDRPYVKSKNTQPELLETDHQLFNRNPEIPSGTIDSNVPDLPSQINLYDARRPYDLILSSTSEGPHTTDDCEALKFFVSLSSADQFFRTFCQVSPVATQSRTIKAYIHGRLA